MLNRIANQYQRWMRPTPVKAISYKPDLAGREHLLSVSATTEQRIDSYADYAKVYEVYSWVRRAIGIIVDATSTLPVNVLDANNKAVEAHPLTPLLQHGNDAQTMAEINSLWTINMMLAGEAFLEVVNDTRSRPVELWNRRPDYIGVIPDANRQDFPKAAGYRYKPETGQGERTIAPERMVHSRFMNPLNDWRGIAPIAAAREGIIIDLYSQQWSKNFLRNNARPDFALVAPQGVTSSERERYLAEFTRRNQGNAHLPVVLEEGVTDIKTFSFAPKDIEWLAQRKYSREEVATVFGIPEEILGFGRDTFENYRTAWEVTWTLTLLPLLRRRDSALTTHFRRYTKWLKETERIETDVSSIDVLNEDMLPRAQVAKQFWDMGVPWNILDERLGLGIGVVPGGDVGWGKAQQVATTASAVQSGNGNGAVVNAQAEEAARLRRWAARRKNPKATDFQSVILSDEQKAAILSEVSTGDGFFPGIVTRRAVEPADPDGDDAERRRIERRAERQIAAGLQTQQERVLATLPETPDDFPEWARRDLEEALRRQPSEDELYDMLRRALLQSVDLGVAAAVGQMDTIGIGFDWTLANDAAREWANRHVGELITDIDATTLSRVRSAVEQWIVNGEPLDALIEDLTPIFGAGRAELIASTEVTRAYAEANRQAYRQAGMRYVRWNTASDERVCFPAWTMISTEHGDMPIQNVRVGMKVWTRAGLRKVVATNKQAYTGAMVRVKTAHGDIVSTADHPYWTLEQGWLQARELHIGHTLQSVNNQPVKVNGVFDFFLGNPTDAPSTSFQVVGFSSVSLGVSMPICTVDFKSDAKIGQQKVNAVSPHFGFLDIADIHGIKCESNDSFDIVFASKSPIASETAKCSIVAWDAAKFLSAVGALFEQWRAAAFLRTIMSRTISLAGESFATSFADRIFRIGSSAGCTAYGVTVGNREGNGEFLTTHWTHFGNSSFGAGDVKTFSATESSIFRFLGSVEGREFSTGGTGDFTRCACKNVVTGRGTKGVLESSLGVLGGRLSAIITGINKWHGIRLLMNMGVLYHRMCSSAIDVYDLQVEHDPEFFANGVLVHNCPVCAPLDGQVVGIDARFDDALPDDVREQFRNLRFEVPPAHPRCRCWLTTWVE